jgi:hypothetical protein
VVDLLKSYCELRPAMMPEQVAGTLLTLDDALRSNLPAILGLFDVQVDDPIWQEPRPSFDGLVARLPAFRRLLFVTSTRVSARLGGKTYYTQIRLGPLLSENADALLQALLGHDASLPPPKQVLIARTEGNPFFAEESVRTPVETNRSWGSLGQGPH